MQVIEIWFWQQRRYLRNGWCINQIQFRGSHFTYWPQAFMDMFRPRAVRG